MTPASGTAVPPALRMGRHSLTRHLLLWSLGALVWVWGSFVFMGYRAGVHEADELTDGHLASVAALLVKLRASQAVEASSTTQPTVAPWLKSHDYQQSISVVQGDAAGRVLVHSGSAPLPAFDAAEGFADLHLGPEAMAWRSFSQWDAPKTRKVMVLLESRERDELARDIAGQMIEPGLWLLPVVALALGLALRRGLRPLYALSADVAALDPASTQRLASRHAWSEFESVVASINTLLDRQQDALVRERRLANEVAHELRTPLSSIALQARALGGGAGPAGAGAGCDPDRAGRPACGPCAEPVAGVGTGQPRAVARSQGAGGPGCHGTRSMRRLRAGSMEAGRRDCPGGARHAGTDGARCAVGPGGAQSGRKRPQAHPSWNPDFRADRAVRHRGGLAAGV